MPDEGVGGLENIAGGAVILFQTNGVGSGEITTELLDVFNTRAAPTVDGLVIITDGEDMRPLTGQQANPRVLDGIGILKFVHQNVLETLTVVFEQTRIFQPQLMGAQQQLGKVHQPGALTQRFIGTVNIDHLPLKGVTEVLDVLGALAFVLARIDKPLRLARRPPGLVQLQITEYAADGAVLVIAVEDLEGLRQTGVLPVHAQQTMGQGVKGAHPHTPHWQRQQALDASTHFGGGLVGKGNREDAVR